jgi:hypothetical protein
MVTQTIAYSPFPDVAADPLDAARGALLGLLLCVPFWIVVIWALR